MRVDVGDAGDLRSAVWHGQETGHNGSWVQSKNAGGWPVPSRVAWFLLNTCVSLVVQIHFPGQRKPDLKAPQVAVDKLRTTDTGVP
jgi:hypothetical protein